MSFNISDLCSDFIEDEISPEETEVDIITFCEAEWGLGLGSVKQVPGLFATQKMVLKAYYGLPLDDTDKCIEIKDKFSEKTLHWFTEVEAIKYLKSDNRVGNVDFDGKKNNLHLVIGRRGSKTTITSVIIAYELYKLLSKYSPHDYYGIMPEDIIEITSVSTNEKTSKNFFDRVTAHLQRSKFFKPYIKDVNQLDVMLQTKRDIDEYGRGARASIKVRAAPCSASGLRGMNNICVVMDEAAFFFRDEGDSGKASSARTAQAIYDAVAPSLAMFNNPAGEPDGKIIMISSPADRTGLFYKEFDRSLDDTKNGDILMFQMPTWEMNKTIGPGFLKPKYYQNPIVYACEYGAEFSDRLRGWIDDAEIVRQNVVANLKYKERSMARIPYFMGVDIGLKKDGTSIVIGHLEEEDNNGKKEVKIEIDFCEIRYSKEEGKDYFHSDEMADWIIECAKKFNVVKGLMDQHYGMAIIPYLEQRGYKQFEARHFNDTRNSEIFQNLLSKMMANKLRLPEGEEAPGKNDKDTELVKEILSLQSVQKSKYLIKVFAPDRDGCHDDLSDGLARCVLVATEYLDKGYGGYSTNSGVSTTAVKKSYQTQLQRQLKQADLKRSSYQAGSMMNRFNGGRGGGLRRG
jgi:hypothetical protein